MKSKIKKCPHCGSTSTLPVAYGLLPDESHQENAEKKEWVWGGCRLGSLGTDYCNDCEKYFGNVTSYKKKQAPDLKKLLKELDEYLDNQ